MFIGNELKLLNSKSDEAVTLKSRGNMPENKLQLTSEQKYLLAEFYRQPFKKMLLSKSERTVLWNSFMSDHSLSSINDQVKKIPSVLQVLENSIETGLNLQSAIISECLFASALADIFGVENFKPFNQQDPRVSEKVRTLLSSHGFVPRFYYSNSDGTKLLFQAGGNRGVDCALVNAPANQIYCIEFKESYAKTSEPDLPLYEEDGFLATAEWFEEKNPQFKSMVEEQLLGRLNFFDHKGSNVNNFSPESIWNAVATNYSGSKFADVIVTESAKGIVTMIPANDATRWARLEGEIRPSGRNHLKAWTLKRFEKYVIELGGKVVEGEVTIPRSKLQERIGRGSGGSLTGLKIASLFFVRVEDTKVIGDSARFRLEDLRQLKPTIAAKMDFKKIDPAEIRDFYLGIINN